MKEGVYSEVETEKFLKNFVPVARHYLTKTLREAESAARKIGFPLVLKIISKDALHKSDINGVRLIKNRLDFEHEYKDLVSISRRKRLRLDGIMVQEYIPGKYVIIGLKRDTVFGHVIGVGTGGIYTELLKDISFRVCPISTKDARQMIEELKLKDILLGFRGSKRVNLVLLEKIIVDISKIPSKYPEISEMDINPFVINEKKGYVVDARMKV